MTEMPVNLLFIEDSRDDVQLALLALERDGLRPSWKRVATEMELREALKSSTPDAILSDFSMPEFDSLAALEISREFAPRVPFIFVSGTIGEERAIEAIRLGATDYVLKDNLRRLGTALRRALAEARDRERVRAAEEERARLVEILEATSDYVGMADPQGRRIYLNAAGRKLTGVSDPHAQGDLSSEIHPGWVREIIQNEALPVAAREGLWQGETAMLNSEGKEIPVSQVVIAHRAPDGGIRFFSTIARDISERKAYEKRIKYLANYDALSGLPNRSLLSDRTAQAMTHARRVGRPCALIVLDIDRFKRINDSYGHNAGDALLRQVGERVRGAVRDGDTTARLEAASFAVLASDLARPDDVLNVTRKVHELFKVPFSIEGHDVHVTLSVGASVFPRDGDNFDALLGNADVAMHRVKANGGKGFQFYAAAMTREATERTELENALRTAVARQELELHYQPQVDLASGRIRGVEALMRWRHAERGWIPPAQFIPVAEESHLIQPLGDWALVEGCRQLAAWDRAGHNDLQVGINVSAVQFRSAGFVEAVTRALRAQEIDPSRLELELTESELIDDREVAISVLGSLKKLGVKISVDDFGTGYSSLNYLSRLPVDCLKIDRSFVVRVEQGGRDAAIVQAIISLAHSLGLRVLAEGVETKEQLRFLRSHGCDEAQGYLFARPCATDAASSLIANRSLRVEL
jgi:diguanylate cyclase (GGDEF)-like protein/PAS domain S-box-containing protein